MVRRISFVVIFVVAVLGGWFYFRPMAILTQPNVILILIDTLRADHLGMYGYQRGTSPNLDKFASENSKFTRAISASNWTPASVASLFTGLYPTSHRYNPPKVISTARLKRGGLFLSSKFLTIAQLFKARKYQTAAVSSNPWIGPELGFGEGFDNFTSLRRLDADKVVASAEEALDKFQQTGGRPFFLYLQFMDPHNPYVSHPESENLFKEDVSDFLNFKYSAHANSRIRLYDGEILNVDLHIGKFFDSLRRRGLYESAKIIIISDHGEQFREHGKAGHGRYLFNEEVRVPLIVKAGGKAQIVDDVVSNIDVLPTIFDFMGISPPKELPGISLINATARKGRPGVFSEVYRDYPQQAFSTSSSDKIIFDIHFDRSGKLVRTLRGLYNYSSDKSEQAPIEDVALQSKLTKLLEETFQHSKSLQKLSGDELIKKYSIALENDSISDKAERSGSLATKHGPQTDTESDDADASSETLKQLKSLGYIGK